MTQDELNAQLLDVCLADEVDYARAEELLRQGAEPLGFVAPQNENKTPLSPDVLYSAVIRHFFSRNDVPEDLRKTTELFLRYGMDIAKPSVPYDDERVSHPLSLFAPPAWSSFSSDPKACRDNALRTLQLLLDHGLQKSDAFACWSEVVWDMQKFFDPSDPEELEWLYDDVRKLMLIASYPHVLNADKELRDVIWYDKNHYDLTRLRNWDDFSFDVVKQRSLILIREKAGGNLAWVFSYHLSEEEY